MRDQFVGDIGDFAKYGLLRALVRDGLAARRVGVVWYANEDDPSSSHGGEIFYLDVGAGVYYQCDPALYSVLWSMVRSGQRSMAAVEKSGLLGEDTPFWAEPTPGRTPQRTDWLAGAVKRMKGCDLVFLDPDNGVSLQRTSGTAVTPEHTYADEVFSFVDQAGLAVVYHTPSRHRKGVSYEDQVEELREVLAGSGSQRNVVFAARWRRYGARFFLIVCKPSRADAVRQVLLSIQHSPWGQQLSGFRTPHFTFSGLTFEEHPTSRAAGRKGEVAIEKKRPSQ